MLMRITRLQKKHDFTDCEVIVGLQQCDSRVEDWFYHNSKSYFNAHFNEVFFDQDRKQEIFQDAFLKIWTEISNKKIDIRVGKVCRQQLSGEYRPMTCSLTTFLMTFAKNEYREMLRDVGREVAYDDFTTSAFPEQTMMAFDTEEEEKEMKNRIVDDCIQQTSPRCIEILTLFYYENKSLDEIMELRADKNTSKNGLKSAKNKCMTSLREKIEVEFRKYNLSI